MAKRYRNRLEAGQALARELEIYRGIDTLVLAVPRGGIPVALPVVEMLGSEMDLIIPRKIGAPLQPEVAIGAVCEDGEVLLNPHMVRNLGLGDDDINEAAAREVAEIKRRLHLYRGSRQPAQVTGRTVIVIDDGVATGFTITAALQSVRRHRPQELVLAVPVAPADTVETLAREVDRVVCPLQPDPFYAVGHFYHNFEQLEDEDVQQLLAQIWAVDTDN